MKGKQTSAPLRCVCVCVCRVFNKVLTLIRVYVKVGSEQYFSNCLLMVLRPQHEKQCTAGAKAKAPGGCNFCSIPSNCISWCKTELVRF